MNNKTAHAVFIIKKLLKNKGYMEIFKQKYYEKIVYPKFLNNINKVCLDNNILVRLKMDEDKITIYYIVENKLLKIEKFTNNPIQYQETDIKNLLHSNLYTNLAEFINDLKLNAEIVSSQNMIDFISNSLKEAVKYYKMSRKENELIYSTILNYNNLFLNNTPSLVIHNEGIKNKWID